MKDYDKLVIGDIVLSRRQVTYKLRLLPKREAEIVRCCFGLCGRKRQKQKEVAKEYKISEERVSQILEKGLSRLRGLLSSLVRIK